jgi:hypothetical protein
MAIPSPKRIAITGAAGQICYSLLFRVARGEVFGPDQPVTLQLLDLPQMLPNVRGVSDGISGLRVSPAGGCRCDRRSGHSFSRY